ncbi:hypothetical protein BJ546DRAFT_270681 [Cryomyces antarcticus]
MFGSSRARCSKDSFSRNRAGKSTKQKRSFRGAATLRSKVEKAIQCSPIKGQASPTMTSAIITLCVGPDQRLFAAHEDVLCHSPFFQAACCGQFFDSTSKRIDLPDEEPEIFSSVLEYLYKGDYYPRLEFDKGRNQWQLEDGDGGARAAAESTVYHNAAGGLVLKDTVIYCTAERYALPELKRLALRKQGLQSGIQCSTILSSARYAYAHTPDSDSKLRAHYLALIVRSRATFKRSGTMQMEMELGGRLFFDLFVAMSNHIDDVANAKSPR